MESRQTRVTDNIRKSVESATRRVAQAVADTPEFISLQRNDRALRSEIGESYEKIGKRVMLLYKKARAESPFERYKTIREELLKLEGLEHEYRENRSRLAEAKRKIRRGRR